MGLCCHVLLLGLSRLESILSHLDAISGRGVDSIKPREDIAGSDFLGFHVIGLPWGVFSELNASRDGS